MSKAGKLLDMECVVRSIRSLELALNYMPVHGEAH